MTRRLSLLGSIVVLGAGCVFTPDQPGHGGVQTGGTLNIDLQPLFGVAGIPNGTPDCTKAGVDTVTATFSGNTLMAVSVPCNSVNGVAIAYESVEPGTYTVTLEGLGNGAVLFGGTGTFNVDFSDPTTYSFDLPVFAGTGTMPTMTPSAATVTLDFSFGVTGTAPGLTCAQAQVTNVNVTVDDGTAASVPCHDPTTSTDSTTLTTVTAGTHTFDLSVVDANWNVLYHSTLSGQVISAGSNEVTAQITGATPGGITLTWAFADASSCAAAGVTFIQYTLDDPTGTPIAQGATSCAQSDGTNGTLTFDTATGQPLAAGLYSLASIKGTDSMGNDVYPASGTAMALVVPAGVVSSFTATLSK